MSVTQGSTQGVATLGFGQNAFERTPLHFEGSGLTQTAWSTTISLLLSPSPSTFDRRIVDLTEH
jgi:hypothetical protein